MYYYYILWKSEGCVRAAGNPVLRRRGGGSETRLAIASGRGGGIPSCGGAEKKPEEMCAVILTSKNNGKIKEARKLADKKYREKYGLFALEGAKLLSDYSGSGGVPVRIFVADDAADRYAALIEGSGCRDICVVPRSVYASLSFESAPEGVMALCRIPEEGAPKEGSFLILEAVRDAGNLGTVVRSAVAFGIENIVLSADCADLYNPKTLRAAMGALFFANIYVRRELCGFVESLKEQGRRVFASVPAKGASDLRFVGLRRGDCVVIGNEGSGISDALISHCTGLVTIPMRGRAESLNAAAAAAVLMWELVRGGGERSREESGTNESGTNASRTNASGTNASETNESD